jgi:hypothetical protein
MFKEKTETPLEISNASFLNDMLKNSSWQFILSPGSD